MAVIEIKTLPRRIAEIRRLVLQNNPRDFSVSPGSVIHDIFITPQAVSDVQQNAIDYMLGVSLSITDILALEKDTATVALLAQALNTTNANIITQLSAFLDNWGENYSLPRQQPTVATGVVQFCRVDPPNVDLTIGVGTIVSTSGGVQFKTTVATTMFASSPTNYFNSDSDGPTALLYCLDVAVEAVDTGSAGNAPVESINTLVSSVNGFAIISNTQPCVGGFDLETDDHYGRRLIEKWQAYGATTKAGVEESANSYVPGVLAAYVARTGDPMSQRGNGRSDVWIQGRNLVQVTEQFTNYTDPDHTNSMMPSHKPVLELVSTSSGTAHLRQDTTSVLAGSVQSKDYIQFSIAPNSWTPVPGPTPVQITYVYDANVENVQGVFNGSSRAPLAQEAPTDYATALTTPILVKEALQVLVDYTATIMVVPRYNPATVKAQVQENIAAMEQNYLLSDPIYQDDINKVVEATPGVLRLAGSPSKFCIDGQSGVEDLITTSQNQYIQLNDINIF